MEIKMLIGLIGESCTGKTTLANKIKDSLGAEIYSGKDYLRLSKNENDAKKLFVQKLESAITGDNVIYIIAEPDQLPLLPEGAFRILLTTDLETIKERFAVRMKGKLPAPVAAMLERKHGCFDQESYNFKIHNGSVDIEIVCQQIKDFFCHHTP